MPQAEVVLVLNGAPPSVARLRELAAVFPILAADGGARICLEADVKPLAVVGDFDSLDPTALPADWSLHRAADQTLTDFEKVVRAIPSGFTRVRILGGLGLRLDHLFSNLLIAAGLPAEWQLVFESENEILTRVTASAPFFGEPPPGSTLSLLPMGRADGVCGSGLHWNLENASLGPAIGLGQSNRVEGPVRVTVSRGVLFVWTPRP